jgi:hypothetical protein
MKMTAHFQLVPTEKFFGAVPPLPPALHGVMQNYVQHQLNLPGNNVHRNAVMHNNVHRNAVMHNNVHCNTVMHNNVHCNAVMHNNVHRSAVIYNDSSQQSLFL